jgi:hypothetical protein
VDAKNVKLIEVETRIVITEAGEDKKRARDEERLFNEYKVQLDRRSMF